MKIKTSELTGTAFDWAVARALGKRPSLFIYEQTGKLVPEHNYSTNWSQGGPIIERENITVRPVFHAESTESGPDIYRQDGWSAHMTPKAFWVTPRPFAGPTPLIAAMRCFVASKLGYEVNVPEDLT